MKKVMWFVAIIPVIVTSIVFQFVPDQIPMHYDMAGNVDRWGNKAESFIFPVVILVMTLFWHLMIMVFEKKAVKSENEKEQQEAKSNAKFLCIVGIAQAIMFGVMHYFILYSSCVEANIGSEKATLDIAKISCLLLGSMLVVLGNFMPKVKNNSIAGVRTTWSMYNDTTWSKSNRVAGVCIVIAGLLTVITTVFADGMISTIFMLGYIGLAAVIAVVYSKIVYDQEKKSH